MYTTVSHLIPTSQNLLLEALPAAEWERAGRNFKPIFMPLGDVLYEPAALVNHIFRASSPTAGQMHSLL
jgi:hypothetical protein